MHLFKSSGKMKLVWISHGIADIFDGQSGCLQKLDGLVHPISDQKFLRTGAKLFTEDSSQIIPVDLTGPGNVGN